MILTTNNAPGLLDKKVRTVYIKDGRRKVMSDGGHTFMPADTMRKMFGKYKGGKYSLKQ